MLPTVIDIASKEAKRRGAPDLAVDTAATLGRLATDAIETPKQNESQRAVSGLVSESSNQLLRQLASQRGLGARRFGQGARRFGEGSRRFGEGLIQKEAQHVHDERRV